MLPSSWQRIYGLVWQEFYLTRHRLEIILDTFFFPMMNVILFGYITLYIGNGGHVDGRHFIMGVLLWEIVVVMQYNVTVSSLWSMWSRNLTNIFIAPISVREYLGAQVIAAFVRTLVVIILLAIGTCWVFNFNILDVGLLNLALFSLNLVLFSCWLGIFLLGLVFRFGLRIQALSWYTVFVFQPLTAAFFPVSVLPGFLQVFAFAFPPTYVFEAARQALAIPNAVNWRYMLIALAINVVYLVAAVIMFKVLFTGSKRTGQFARNDL